VVEAGPVALEVHPDVPVVANSEGVTFAQVSRKGKPMPQAACLAGFRDLEVRGANGDTLLKLHQEIDGILRGQNSVEVKGARQLVFTRRQIQYGDLVKGDLAKPLDSMRDFVIVRSDGSPMFHLANVCDDIAQGITHIIRGDDHVENTYRHMFLFGALGAEPPQYAHLPMIVSASGKPYSKRDGDAFVGDFREKGFLPEALFNYLTLLGWSPGDDREKLSRPELIELFTLDRVQKAPAQVDLRKLANLNGQYMAELPLDDFVAAARESASGHGWARNMEDPAYFARVAALMQSRTKLLADVAGWKTFFVELPDYDEKACGKFLRKPGVRAPLVALADRLRDAEFTPAAVERTVHDVTGAFGIPEGKLNQPIRVAVTGSGVGAGVYETVVILGRERVLKRLHHAAQAWCPA
jgi:glutamyl-tRNA synthetase